MRARHPSIKMMTINQLRTPFANHANGVRLLATKTRSRKDVQSESVQERKGLVDGVRCARHSRA
jgi:hypothetical protein